jgi:pSer/pThr/pTyr-binding forkhead associated (FHA) protein
MTKLLNQANTMQTENPEIQIHSDVLRFAVWDHADIVEVPANQMITLGRSSDNHLVTVDLDPFHGRLLGVSRRHAMVFPTPSGFAVRDLNSANGTCLNGTPLQHGKAYTLQHSDELQLGGLYLTVYFGKAE